MIGRLSNNVITKSLTFLIQFNASKMQASSTQNTKDSDGRRLGYWFIIKKIDWKSLVVKKFTLEILLPDKEVSNGNQVKMFMSEKIKLFTQKSKVLSSSETVCIERFLIKSLTLFQLNFQIEKWSILLLIFIILNSSLKELN